MTQMQGDPSSPADDIVAVTPDDSTLLQPTRALWVAGAGDISVTPAVPGAANVTITGVPAGTLLPVRVIRVRATGTTATGIVALR